jgi:LPXTG-motif cell wall-anchored protein
LLTSGPKTTKSTVVVQKGIDNGTFNILIALAGILVVLIGIVSVLLFKRKQKITDKEDKDESVAKAEVFKGGDPSVEVVGLSNPTDAESEEGCPDDEAGMKSVEIL